MKTTKKPSPLTTKYIVLAFLLVMAFFLSIGIGKYPISPQDIYRLLTGGDVSSLTQSVFYNLRIPRVFMSLIAGFGLSIAGSVYQTIFKNPLATPDLIGVSSGANLGAAVAITFFAGGTSAIAISAFIGGVIAVFTALGLTRLSAEKSITTFVLAGIVISSLAQGFIMLLKVFADPEHQLAAMEFWAMGSFASITRDKLISILPFVLIGLIGLLLLRWQINLLSLSDEEGRSLGIPVGLIRFFVVLFATLLVASIVSITGLISFIGLIAPHIGRMLTKRNDTHTLVLSGLVGALLLIISDSLARSLTASELPISILTTFIGAPYLGYLMIRLRQS